MRGRRLLYAALVLAAFFYYVFHSGYGSWFVFVVVIGFLPLELLLSLPAYLTTKLSFEAIDGQVPCGQTCQLRLRIDTKFPVCAVKAVLTCKNLFTGDVQKRRVRVVPGERNAGLVEFSEAACGLVECTLKRPGLLDVAGLFSLPLKTQRVVTVLVRPSPLPAPPQLPPAGGWQSARPQPGASRPGPGSVREYTDLREYRDGDSLRDVHWKLSTKWDKLVVKEASAPLHSALRLGFDCYGEPATVCRALARLEALSVALWEMERPHEIAWRSGGELHRQPVFGKSEFDAFLLALLAKPLLKTGEPVVHLAAASPEPFFVVSAEAVSVYEHGALREVLP